MKTFIHPVSCKYGAPMGRHTGPADLFGRCYLRRVPLDRGGYDRGGAYWGLGPPLYEVIDQDGSGWIFRARNRNAAKTVVLSAFPDVTFYR